MKYLLTNEELSNLDRTFIDEYHMNTLMLMENASQKCAHLIKDLIKKDEKILFVIGNKNNAGDGVCIARELHLSGFQVEVLKIISNENETLKLQMEIARKLGVKISEDTDEFELENFNWIVDCIYGIGFNGKIKDPKIAEKIEKINQAGKKIISIDIPSGLTSELKEIEQSIKADITLSIGARKKLFYYPFNRKFCGEIYDIDLGYLSDKIKKQDYKIRLIDEEDIPKVSIPKDFHKGKRGRLLIISGSKEYIGAPVLVSGAASRTPCGYINLVVPEEVYPYTAQKTGGEVISEYKREELTQRIRASNVVCSGSGLEENEENESIFLTLLKEKQDMVLDALFLEKLKGTELDFGYRTIITPHPKEMQRLCGVESIEKIIEDPFEYCIRISKRYKVIVVYKSNITIVCKEDNVYLIEGELPSLGVAGSGDVLVGIISGLYAFTKDPLESAIMGVCHHKQAGLRATEKYGFFDSKKIIEEIFIKG